MRLIMLLATLLTLLAVPAMAAPVNTGHIEAELVAQEAAVPGGTVVLAVRQKIADGWHTYWRNPGDAGAATKLAWTLPDGWKAGEIHWPTPTQLLEGAPPNQLGVYAYEGEALLLIPVEIPATTRPDQAVELKVAASFLVCAETCIPEDALLTLSLPVTGGAPRADPVWGPRIAEALARLPKPAALTARYSVTGPTLALAVTGEALKGADAAGAYFFPFSGTVIKQGAPAAIERGPEGLTLSLPAGYAFTEGTPPGSVVGVLALGDRAFEISATAGPPPAGASGLGPPPSSFAGKGGLGLLGALLFAFLGGLILNLMPCVFPILSMKAASLAGHAHETTAARRQGLAYLAGVLTTFVGLAAVLIALKSVGAAIGWGFQLQSAGVVAALALLMLLVALNLSGVFEIGTSLQGVGGHLADGRAGMLGSFLTGVLAVAVAAPCTAPFMGPAMGFALTQSAPVALLVFAGLGLGLAAPFVALSFVPALLRLMPRPGPWMETLRNVLAFPMYGTVAWLVWVLARQTGPLGLALALAAVVVVAFAAWLFGQAQTQDRAPVRRGLAALALLAAAGLVYGVTVAPSPTLAAPTAAATDVGAELASEPWSPERVAALRAEGRPVFVNFTAAWCVTCQVNDAAAIARPATAEAFRQANAVYLVADWTNRDATIAAALAEHGRAGVPLYLVYGAAGSPPVVLPQLLSEGMVIEAVQKAAKR